MGPRYDTPCPDGWWPARIDRVVQAKWDDDSDDCYSYEFLVYGTEVAKREHKVDMSSQFAWQAAKIGQAAGCPVHRDGIDPEEAADGVLSILLATSARGKQWVRDWRAPTAEDMTTISRSAAGVDPDDSYEPPF